MDGCTYYYVHNKRARLSARSRYFHLIATIPILFFFSQDSGSSCPRLCFVQLVAVIHTCLYMVVTSKVDFLESLIAGWQLIGSIRYFEVAITKSPFLSCPLHLQHTLSISPRLLRTLPDIIRHTFSHTLPPSQRLLLHFVTFLFSPHTHIFLPSLILSPIPITSLQPLPFNISSSSFPLLFFALS